MTNLFKIFSVLLVISIVNGQQFYNNAFSFQRIGAQLDSIIAKFTYLTRDVDITRNLNWEDVNKWNNMQYELLKIGQKFEPVVRSFGYDPLTTVDSFLTVFMNKPELVFEYMKIFDIEQFSRFSSIFVDALGFSNYTTDCNGTLCPINWNTTDYPSWNYTTNYWNWTDNYWNTTAYPFWNNTDYTTNYWNWTNSYSNSTAYPFWNNTDYTTNYWNWTDNNWNATNYPFWNNTGYTTNYWNWTDNNWNATNYPFWNNTGYTTNYWNWTDNNWNATNYPFWNNTDYTTNYWNWTDSNWTTNYYITTPPYWSWNTTDHPVSCNGTVCTWSPPQFNSTDNWNSSSEIYWTTPYWNWNTSVSVSCNGTECTWSPPQYNSTNSWNSTDIYYTTPYWNWNTTSNYNWNTTDNWGFNYTTPSYNYNSTYYTSTPSAFINATSTGPTVAYIDSDFCKLYTTDSCARPEISLLCPVMCKCGSSYCFNNGTAVVESNTSTCKCLCAPNTTGLRCDSKLCINKDFCNALDASFCNIDMVSENCQTLCNKCS